MSNQLITQINTPSARSSFTSNRSVDTMKFRGELQYLEQLTKKNRDLLSCSADSLQTCMLDVAFSGLSLRPSLGHAYIIPYGSEATFSPGYRGLLWLVYKAGTIKSVQTNWVHAADPTYRKWTDDTGTHILHEETRGERDMGGDNQNPFPNLQRAYCIAEFTNGGRHVEEMDRKQLLAVRNAATKRNKGGMVWLGPFASEMIAKAVIRRAWKKWPLDDDGVMARAMEVADKYDPVEFDDEPESTPPTDYVCINEDQQLELHAFLTDRGLTGAEADTWLRRYAEARGLSSIAQLPADAVDEAKKKLGDRLDKVNQAKQAAGGETT